MLLPNLNILSFSTGLQESRFMLKNYIQPVLRDKNELGEYLCNTCIRKETKKLQDKKVVLSFLDALKTLGNSGTRKYNTLFLKKKRIHAICVLLWCKHSKKQHPKEIHTSLAMQGFHRKMDHVCYDKVS